MHKKGAAVTVPKGMWVCMCVPENGMHGRVKVSKENHDQIEHIRDPCQEDEEGRRRVSGAFLGRRLHE